MPTRSDAIVIGAGQSGPALAARMAGEGLKTAIVERHLFGGTCVNTGCIPTKTLVASARAAHVARRAGDFGVNVGGSVSVDMKAVKARKDRVSGVSNSGVEKWMRGTDNITVYTGHARFTGPTTVEVNGEVLEAERIALNVGGRAFVPDMPGIDQVACFTNSGMMTVDFLPDHLVIVGGSYIGLEFGQMYRRFGSRITIVEKGERLIGREDADVSEEVRRVLEAEGLDIVTGAECLSVEPYGNGIAVNAGGRKVHGSHLLMAVGRRPNTDDLGLDKAGVEIDARGYIVVDDQLRTNVPGIWATGDANGRGAFTHTSYNDYQIVAANMFDDDPRRVSDRITAYALYTDPPLGRAGMSEGEVRKSGKKALMAKMPMSRVSRAFERDETDGFMKILVDAETKKILGAAILGIGGDEVVHSLLDIMYAGAPYTVVQRAMHIHPTVTEMIPTMLGSLEPLD